MTRLVPAVASLLSLAAGLSAPSAAALEIRHLPLPCVVVDRFARVAATASPAARTAELRFRADPAGPWYAVAMKPENGEWSAFLPRPTASLPRFEYSIVMSGEGQETAETPAYPVTVGTDPAACGGADRSSVSSSIVVQVPAGAPVVPPVPLGFNPTGVVAAEQPVATGGKKAYIIGGAAAVAAAVGGLAVAGGGSDTGPPGPDPIPGFHFEGTNPAPESTVSISQGTLQIFLRMDREPTDPLTVDWRAEWRATGFAPICVTMAGTLRGVQRPTDLVLTGPLLAQRPCGDDSRASFVRIQVTANGLSVFDMIGDLPFRFEP